MSIGLHLTVDEFDQMVDRGAFDHLNRRIELIRGELFEIDPSGPLHDDLIMYLTSWSARATAPQEISVTSQTGLRLEQSNSRPEPDLMWVRAARYRTAHPAASDVKLAIEVAWSSLSFDLITKAELYAAAGIMEYWVVDSEAECVHVFRNPQESAYADRCVANRGDTLSPLAEPAAILSIDDLFAA